MTRSTIYDAVVIGGSVGGSATALALTGLGYRVAIVERDPRFRDRIRGEGLHPWGVDEAEDLGLLPVLSQAAVQPLPIWLTYTDRVPGEPYHWADDSARGHGECGVAHPRLQQAMLEAAEQAGVTVFRPVAMTSVASTGTGYDVSLDSGQLLSTRLLIGADGPHSRTRTLLGIRSTVDPRHHWFAGLLIRDFDLAKDTAHAGLIPGGRFFILPQGDGQARAYVALMPNRIAPIQADRTGKSLIQLLSEHLPEGALSGAQPAGPQGIFSNADIWPERVAAPMAVLIGDAAGANDPSLGHGNSLVFRDARELRDLVAEHGISQRAIDRFAERRAAYYGTLRVYAMWMSQLMLEEGAEAEERRTTYFVARESDPDAGGFASITALGPRDLVADEEARRRFFGEAQLTAAG